MLARLTMLHVAGAEDMGGEVAALLLEVAEEATMVVVVVVDFVAEGGAAVAMATNEALLGGTCNICHMPAVKTCLPDHVIKAASCRSYYFFSLVV